MQKKLLILGTFLFVNCVCISPMLNVAFGQVGPQSPDPPDPPPQTECDRNIDKHVVIWGAGEGDVDYFTVQEDDCVDFDWETNSDADPGSGPEYDHPYSYSLRKMSPPYNKPIFDTVYESEVNENGDYYDNGSIMLDDF